MNILLTGATGLLGSCIVESHKNIGNLFGVYLGNYELPNRKDLTYYNADVRDKKKMGEIFRKSPIDVVIHTAGEARVDFCEKNYKEAHSSNVAGTKNIIELCRKYKSKLIYISTNAVFDGTKPPYKEGDMPNPINAYGRIKLECENLARASIGDFLLVRPILMYGWNRPEERDNVATWILKKLRRNEPVKLVDDIFDNPLYALQCADIILKLIERKKSGIYHIAGGEILSKYQFGLKVAGVFGCNKNLIKPVKNIYFKNIAPRPGDTSYDTSKIRRELGIKPMHVREGLLEMLKGPNTDDHR